MKVSVVIPTFNNEDTIGATVESALTQRFDGEFEVIVVNDGSTDGTPAELAKFGDRIRMIDQENRGVSPARNAGIAAAAGEYIALLDGDDWWTGDKLSKTVPVLERNPAAVAVFSDVMQVDGAGKEYGSYVLPEFRHSPTLDEMLASPWPALPSSTVFRRDTLITIGGFSEQFSRFAHYGEDTFAFLLAREQGEIDFVADKLVRYRVSGFNGHLARRNQSRDNNDRGNRGIEEFVDPERQVGGLLVFARLVQQHFGVRGRKLAEWAIDYVAKNLVATGLKAMHEGNRELARRCYVSSIRKRPLVLKTYVRLAWTVLPPSVTEMLSPMLPPQLRRSLSGPPFHGLEDRTE